MSSSDAEYKKVYLILKRNHIGSGQHIYTFCNLIFSTKELAYEAIRQYDIYGYVVYDISIKKDTSRPNLVQDKVYVALDTNRFPVLVTSDFKEFEKKVHKFMFKPIASEVESSYVNICTEYNICTKYNEHLFDQEPYIEMTLEEQTDKQIEILNNTIKFGVELRDYLLKHKSDPEYLFKAIVEKDH